MNEVLKTPPVSGDNLPLKDLELKKASGKKPLPHKVVETAKTAKMVKKAKTKKKLYIILALTLFLFLFFIGGVSLGFYLRQRKSELPAPSPSPSPSLVVEPEIEASHSPSPQPTGLTGRADSLEERLKGVDLDEKKLLPPVLDFDIRFEVEE